MMKSGSLKFFGKGVGDTSSRFECKFCSSIVTKTTNQFNKKLTIVCPYGVSNTSMSKVTKVHDLMHELLQWCTQKDLTSEG
jgi:hypothetical protein